MQGDGAMNMLRRENDGLRDDIEKLRMKAKEQQLTIDLKTEEIKNLQRSLNGQVPGNESEAVRKLTETNQRLSSELQKVTEQLRRIESMNDQSYLSGTINSRMM